MISKEQAKQMYNGVFFYEIVPAKDGLNHQLIGPLDSIRYTAPLPTSNHPAICDSDDDYKYVQIINDEIVNAFKGNEIIELNFDVSIEGNNEQK